MMREITSAGIKFLFLPIVEEYVNGQPAGDGFVFPTPSGLVKIVDREVFSAANFAKNG
jgi:hypothetical protein